MELFIQLTLTGLTSGAILALAALGFVLIYKSSDVINFAQGEFLLIGAYVIFAMLTQAGLHWTFGLVLTIAVAVGLGVMVERLVLRPMIGEPIISVIMVTIGLSSLLKAIVSTIWGNTPQAFPPFIPSEPVNIMGATVGQDRLWALVIAAVLLGGFNLFFRRSREGIAMRAVADDQQAALSMGISVNAFLPGPGRLPRQRQPLAGRWWQTSWGWGQNFPTLACVFSRWSSSAGWIPSLAQLLAG